MKTACRNLALALVLGIGWEGVWCSAADCTWNRTTTATGTNWEEVTYWTGGLPGTNDLASFNSISPRPNASCYPTLSNNAVVTIGGIYIHGMYDLTAGWKILNADPNNPGRIVLGSMGISNNFRCGGATNIVLQPDIQLDVNQTWSFDPYQNDSGPLFLGNISGTGSLTRAGGAGVTYYRRRQSPTFSGGLTIAAGGMLWDQVGLTNTDAGVYGFGTAPITLAGGDFIWSCTALTNNNAFVMDLTNAIRVVGTGSLRYGQLGGSGYYPNCRFSGPVTLGGILRLWGSGTYSVGLMPRYEGAMRIDRTNGWSAGLSKGNPASAASGFDPQILNAGIEDGPGAMRKPLVLHSAEYRFELGGTNTYSGGTVVSACGSEQHAFWLYAGVAAGTGSSLGTGDVTIEPGGRLQLSSSNNLAAGATVTVRRTTSSLGVLTLATNWCPSISSDSEGVVAISASSFSAISNLATLGNGRMFLGTDRNGGTFTGTVLAPGADNTYRLGAGTAGEHVLTISSPVLTGTASVLVGQPAWFGNGIVSLTSSNTFTGNIEVRSLPVFANGTPSTQGATLMGTARTVSDTSPFGSTNGAVSLYAGTLRLAGVSSGKPVAKQTLTYSGFNRLYLDSQSPSLATLQFSSLSRANRGFLQIYPYRGQLGSNETVLVTSQADTACLPPYLVYQSNQSGVTGPDFVSYDATGGTGIRRFAGYNYNLLTSTASDVVSWAGILGGGSYAAKHLVTTNNITGTGTINLGDGTFAGLILGGNFSDAGTTLNFGSSEGILYSGTGNRTINAKVSGSGGLTFAPFGGYNDIIMTNANNDFSGDLTVNGGRLQAALDSATGVGSLGNANNGIYLNGGCLSRSGAGDRLLASRTITLGPAGGRIVLASGTIYSRITGTGPLMASTYVLASSGNDYSGGTWLTECTMTITNGSTAGTGPVNIGQNGVLTVLGNDGVNAAARVSVGFLGTANFQSAAPVIGSLTDCGNVKLGTASAATTLTLGGDDTSFDFHGSISEISASYPCGVVKTGSGTFTLYGNHTYTGPTAVNEGALVLYGALARNLNVASGAALQASGIVGGSLTNNGALAMSAATNELATLTVGGDLVLGSTASLTVNLAGTNSDAVVVGGTVSLAAGATIAVTGDKPVAGTTYTLIQAPTVSGTAPTVTTDGYTARIVNGNQLQLVRKVQGFIFLMK